MPRDDWRKVQISKRIKGRDHKQEQEAEEAHDAELDAWIAQQEAQRQTERKQKNKGCDGVR